MIGFSLTGRRRRFSLIAILLLLVGPDPGAARAEEGPQQAALAVPMIAIVIDDLGLDRVATAEALALPAPLTLAFMTYAEGLRDWGGRARAAGHELLLHVPMEPLNPDQDAGPRALAAGQGAAGIAANLDWGLARLEGAVGINNHMGSRFTADREALRPVMAVLKRRGLLFLDSRTTAETVAVSLAREMGVAHLSRDLFLDHGRPGRAAVEENLAALEALARQRGAAVAIGHPNAVTLAALAAWLPGLAARGIALAPVSAVAARQEDRRLAGLGQ